MPAPKRPKLNQEEQSALFVKTARELGADESEDAFNEKLGKVAKAKMPDNPKPSVRKKASSQTG